jgi:N-carbamoylputrescine amidase
MDILSSAGLPSPCPHQNHSPRKLTLAAVQMRWHADAQLHRERLELAVSNAANTGAEIVFLPELTLSKYPADQRPTGRADAQAEALAGGPTHEFCAALAARYDVHVHGSLFERSDAADGRGLNTAIVVSPSGEIVATTRKMHIPVTNGYFEDHYFAAGSAERGYPVHNIALDTGDCHVGLPTCWDEWFPEVARSYALGGADIIVYPTAIGSEPDFPAFDTQPLLRQTLIGHAIANGLFVVMANRFGGEGQLNFYGSSVVIDPFGRVLLEAPRDREAVLVAEIDIALRHDWLTLFPFFATRRPDSYAALTEPLVNPRQADGQSELGGIPGILPR